MGRDAERGGGRGAAAFARRVRALPVGPCPLAPLAICEKLNYVAVEEERAAKDAAEACADTDGEAVVVRGDEERGGDAESSGELGETAFAREVRIVPLPGKRGGSRAPSFDHALTALCDLRMNKLSGTWWTSGSSTRQASRVEARVRHRRESERTVGDGQGDVRGEGDGDQIGKGSHGQGAARARG